MKIAAPLERNKTLFFWLILLGVILAALALRANLLYSFPLSPDEGIHLIWLRLLAAGYQPYREVYITYPPLYPLTIQAIWQLWPTEAAQRWFSVGYTIFGAVGIALCARRLAGPVAGVAAAGLTLFSAVVMEPSRAVLAEFPSVGWTVWAIWLAWLAADQPNKSPHLSKRRILLGLSGLCLAISLLTKLLAPFVFGLIPLILGLKGWQANRSTWFKSWLADLMIWVMALLIPVVLLASLFNIEPLIRQVVGQRLQARSAVLEVEPFWPPRYERGQMFGQEDAVLAALGLAGIGLAGWFRPKDGWLIGLWLLLALAMLAIHNPIRYKHYLILVPPLAIFGSLALKYWLDAATLTLAGLLKRQSHTLPARTTLTAWLGLAIVVGLYAWQIPATLALWQAKAAVPQPPPDEAAALAFIQTITTPQDCLITDDMPLLYWSGRMTPPELAEVSTNRLDSGALTTPQLIELTERYDCPVIAAITNRITKYLPDYMAWVQQKYLGRFHFGEDDLYVAKVNSDPRPAQPLQANFEGQIELLGYTLGRVTTQAGQRRLPLTLFWRARRQPPADYAVFVQLRDSANTTLANADFQPYQGLVPTSRWPAGATLPTVTWLTLPPNLGPGQYPLYVGLYYPNTLERLPLSQDSSAENALIIGPVAIP
jgi:hypothetical protein